MFNISINNQQQRLSLPKRISLEWSTWASLALVAALMEGGVIGVIIKNGFQNQVSDWLLNFSVALATGAPFFSNLFSFIWVGISQGRSKARLISNLALSFCFCSFLMAFVEFTDLGLLLFLSLLIVARVIWSGILTIRSNIWRANYPRYIRGKVTAKLSTLSAFIMSVSGITIGWILDWQFESFSWVFIVFSILSMLGAFRYRQLAVRHQQREIIREKSQKNTRSLFSIFFLLKTNNSFAKYMFAMFLLGSGNLMFMAPLIVFINDHAQLEQLQQILITTAIPLALIPFVVGWWARLLDGNHIFHFRSIHSWAFVCAILVFLLAQISGVSELFFLGAFVYGIGIAGGVIGWNLGHNDFVSKNVAQVSTDNNSHNTSENSMDYMAVHVTLTGIRGLIMPLVGIAFYQWLESYSLGLGKFALILPLMLTLSGAILFVIYNQQNKKVCH